MRLWVWGKGEGEGEGRGEPCERWGTLWMVGILRVDQYSRGMVSMVE